MAIVIHSIIKEEKDYVIARVTHGGQSLQLRVAIKANEIECLDGKELIGELSYEEVLSTAILKEFHDEESGVFESEGATDEHIVIGRIHSITEVDEQEFLIDLYLQTGPEFILISSKSFSSMPEPGKGVMLTLRGLCFYPTDNFNKDRVG